MDGASHPAASEHDLILSSRVKGTRVFNPDGENIGHIEDISIEKHSGIARFGLISFGGFLGVGDHLHPVPWSLLTYDVTKGGYIVPLTKDQLKKAPNYTPQQLEAYGGGDAKFRADVFTYYGTWGVVPYW